jgi:hypothetical protein
MSEQAPFCAGRGSPSLATLGLALISVFTNWAGGMGP